MKRLIHFWGIVLLGIALPTGAAQSGKLRSGRLQCGQAQLESHTRYLDVPGHARQILSQSLTLQYGQTGTPVSLPHDGRWTRVSFVRNAKVLDAVVNGWACLESQGRHYVYVLYACTATQSRSSCSKQQEWPRLFDEQGKALAASRARTDARASQVMKQLGLAHYLDAGVALQDIDE